MPVHRSVLSAEVHKANSLRRVPGNAWAKEQGHFHPFVTGCRAMVIHVRAVYNVNWSSISDEFDFDLWFCLHSRRRFDRFPLIPTTWVAETTRLTPKLP